MFSSESEKIITHSHEHFFQHPTYSLDDVSINYNFNKILFPVYILNTQSVLSYYIEVRKFHVIEIILIDLQSFKYAVFYEGPSFLVIPKKITFFDPHCFSFQCIVQVMVNTNTSFPGLLTYIQKPLLVQNCFKLTINETLTITMSNLFVRESFHYECIQSPSNYEINGTLSTFTSTGLYSPNCHFGGLAVGERVEGALTDMYSICDKENENFKRIYSHNSLLLLLVYGNRQVTTTYVSVTLSLTKCNTRRFDPCLYTRFRPNFLYFTISTRNSTLKFSHDKRSPRLYLTDNTCIVVEFATRYSTLLKFPLNLLHFILYLDCRIELSTGLSLYEKGIQRSIAIERISGLSESLPLEILESLFAYTMGDYCTNSTACVKDQFGSAIPRAQSKAVNSILNRNDRLKFLIHQTNTRVITSLSISFEYFSKFWVDVVIASKKQEVITKIGRILAFPSNETDVNIDPPVKEESMLREYVFSVGLEGIRTFSRRYGLSFVDKLGSCTIKLVFTQDFFECHDLLNWKHQNAVAGEL